MIIITIAISIMYIILLILILKAYYKGVDSLEDRVLQLEVRLEKYRKEIKNKKVK